MIELFDTGVVTSTINGFRGGTVPTTATNINYNTVVPQPFTHQTRLYDHVEGLEARLNVQRISLGSLKSKVDRMDNDISEISEFTDEVTSDIEDLRRQIRELQEAMRIFPCRT